MDATLAHIFRHPIKGIGSEAMRAASLSPDGAMEGDRAWALLNEDAPDTDAWQPRRNFLQVASGPALAPVDAFTEGSTIRLRHPQRAELRLVPAEGGAALAEWIGGLWPAERPGPARLVRAQGHGMTDMPEPYVSIGNLSTLREVSKEAGHPLDMRRFRINLWVDGLAPWQEFDLIGATFQIGDVPLRGAERIGRCRAPEANPDTGERDTPTNRLLDAIWGHTDFGIYARVTAAGGVSVGDRVAF